MIADARVVVLAQVVPATVLVLSTMDRADRAVPCIRPELSPAALQGLEAGRGSVPRAQALVLVLASAVHAPGALPVV